MESSIPKKDIGKMMTKKLWGGRFRSKTDPSFDVFSRQASVDEALLVDDLRGSLAYAKMLGKIKILSKREATRLASMLTRLLKEALQGKIVYPPTSEDVHSFVESLLMKKVGPLAKKLHTGRSRNDQVSLDTRLFCKRGIVSILWHLVLFQKALVQWAHRHRDVILPGYTHLQHAQPIYLAHHVLAYCEMLERDKERLLDALDRLDVLPLGSGAIAGSLFRIDRAYLAKELGFSRISENSMDAVSDRDFVIEVLSGLSILVMHLSRFSEELILWNSQEFGFIRVDEKFATGSSMMPQKRNPDFLELVRGETGRVYGNLVSVLTLMKGLPLAYNRDMQLDKAPLMESLSQLHQILKLFPPCVTSLKINKEAIQRQLKDDGLLATDLAEYLVQQGVSFREAHGIVGKLYRFLDEKKRRLDSLSLSEFQKFSPAFRQEVFNILSVEQSVSRKFSFGGTGKKEVTQAIRKWQRKLSR